MRIIMKQQQAGRLEEEVGEQQEKLRGTYHRLEGCIDRFIELYAQAERAARAGQDEQQVMAQLNRELLALRPLRTVREHFLHHYRRLSNLLRKLHAPANAHRHPASSRYSRRNNSNDHADPQDDRLSGFFGGLMNREEEVAMLEELIVENYLRRGEWECAAVWPKAAEAVDQAGLFRECLTLREAVRRGELSEAIRWCENERLYETHSCMLEYELRVMHLLGLMRTAPHLVLPYFPAFAKFQQEKKQELEKLYLFALSSLQSFWGEDGELQTRLGERYGAFAWSEGRLEELAEQLYRAYLRQSEISRFNSLEIIYGCSQKIMEEFMRMMRLVWAGRADKKDAPILPFSVKLAREHQYHSLFYCPVTKEVHASSDPSRLLACGHLISENAHNRIVQENRNRRKIKCPICQKEIKPEDSLKAEF